MAKKVTTYYYKTKSPKWDKEKLARINNTVIINNHTYNRDNIFEYDINTLVNDFKNCYWNEIDYIKQSEILINELFLSYSNIDESLILNRVIVLNSVYSTNIYLKEMPTIVSILIKYEEVLNEDSSDVSIVNKICDEIYNKLEEKRYLYSFVTKYCSHKKDMIYPIYDRYVEIMLKWYRDNGKVKEFTFSDDALNSYKHDKKSFGDYNSFKKIISDFQKYYAKNISYKDIDVFLWSAGKEFFPIYTEQE